MVITFVLLDDSAQLYFPLSLVPKTSCRLHWVFVIPENMTTLTGLLSKICESLLLNKRIGCVRKFRKYSFVVVELYLLRLMYL
jgi:hypothetical protein